MLFPWGFVCVFWILGGRFKVDISTVTKFLRAYARNWNVWKVARKREPRLSFPLFPSRHSPVRALLKGLFQLFSFSPSNDDVSKAVVRVVEEKGFLTLLSEEGVMALAALLSSPLTQLQRYVQTHMYSHCNNYVLFYHAYPRCPDCGDGWNWLTIFLVTR